jgi:hypothetical protein
MRAHYIILEPLVQGKFFANALLIHLLLHPLQLFYPNLQSLDPLPLHLISLEAETLGHHLGLLHLPRIDVILRVEHSFLRENPNEAACKAANQRLMILSQ